MANEVKHEDLTVQQKAEIQKSIVYGIKANSFWDKFCSHVKANDGRSAYEWLKLNLKTLTRDDLNDLVEGKTPDGMKLDYCQFRVFPRDFGNYIGYTDKAKKYNFTDVVADAKTKLANDALQQCDLRKGEQFMATACTMSFDSSIGKSGFLMLLLKARTMLRKNHIFPISGQRFGAIVPSEIANAALLLAADAITHTSQKESLINGYIGEIGGFILFENTDALMYEQSEGKEAVPCVASLTEDETVDSSKTYYERVETEDAPGHLVDSNHYRYTPVAEPVDKALSQYYEVSVEGEDGEEEGTYGNCLFIGKTEEGMPVKTVAFGNDSVEIINKPLGTVPDFDVESGNVVKVKPDALNQRGTVGYKVMGFATAIVFDEAIIRCKIPLDEVISISVADEDRTHFVAKSVSPTQKIIVK